MSKQPTRNKCRACNRRIAVEFVVSDEVWHAVVPNDRPGALCIECFASDADEKLVKWEDRIEFRPQSMVTRLRRYNKLQDYDGEVTT